jgi:hypothetical protein
MTKRNRGRAESYIERCSEPWLMRDAPICDVCSNTLDKKRVDKWVEASTPPYFCEEHARELNLLW